MTVPPVPIAYEAKRLIFIPKTRAEKPVCGSCGASSPCEWALCPLRLRA